MQMGHVISLDKLGHVAMVGAGAIAATYVSVNVQAVSTLNSDVRNGAMVLGGLVLAAFGGSYLKAFGMGVGAVGVVGFTRDHILTG